MKILIAASIQSDSGYEEKELVNALQEELKQLGHTVDNFLLPYVRDMLDLPNQIVAMKLLSVDIAEMLITIGYPACFIEHPNKRIFLFHMTPMLTEYWDTEYGTLGNPEYSRILIIVRDAEKKMLESANKVIAGSMILKKDILEKSGIHVDCLYLPNIHTERGDKIKKPSEKYIVSESNLFPESRVELLLESIVLCDIKLLLFVPRTSLIYKETLYKQIKELGISDKVEIYFSAAPKDIVESAECCVIVDYQIRKIGNIVPRAMVANCPIIVTCDSGSATELACDSDMIIKPSAEEIAVSIKICRKNAKSERTRDKLASIAELAKKLVNE